MKIEINDNTLEIYIKSGTIDCDGEVEIKTLYVHNSDNRECQYITDKNVIAFIVNNIIEGDEYNDMCREYIIQQEKEHGRLL